MSTEITEAYAEGFDAEREALGIDEPLKLFERKAGSATIEPFVIEYGWFPTKERNRGGVETLYVVEVTEREELTQEIVSTTDRMEVNGVLCKDFTWEAPDREPRVWIFYGREVKPGGVKR